MGLSFKWCGGHNKKKSSYELMKETQLEARKKISELQAQQDSIAQLIEQKMKEAMTFKIQKKDQQVIKSKLREVAASKKKFETLEKFKCKYVDTEQMLEETINIIDYTGIAGVANDVIKKGMTEMKNLQNIMDEAKQIQEDIAEFDAIVDNEDFDIGETEGELEKDAIESSLRFIESHLWKFISEDFSSELLSSFSDEFELQYIMSDEISSVSSIMGGIQTQLPSVFKSAFEQFEKAILANSAFLKEGSLTVISTRLSTLLQEWVDHSVFPLVSRTLLNELSVVSESVFEDMYHQMDKKRMKEAFKEALVSMQKKVTQTFKEQWTRVITQGSVKKSFESKKDLSLSELRKDLDALIIPSSPLPRSPVLSLPSVPSAPIYVQETSSVRKESPALVMD